MLVGYKKPKLTSSNGLNTGIQASPPCRPHATLATDLAPDTGQPSFVATLESLTLLQIPPVRNPDCVS